MSLRVILFLLTTHGYMILVVAYTYGFIDESKIHLILSLFVIIILSLKV